MARAARKPEGPGWGKTLLSLGLAAVIAGVATVSSDLIKADAERRWRHCDRAAAILQDETLTPYRDEAGWRRIASAAARQVERCLTEDQ